MKAVICVSFYCVASTLEVSSPLFYGKSLSFYIFPFLHWELLFSYEILLIIDNCRFVDSGVDCAEKSSADLAASTGKLSFKGEFLNIKESRELESNPALQHSQQNNLHKPMVPDSPFTVSFL